MLAKILLIAAEAAGIGSVFIPLVGFLYTDNTNICKPLPVSSPSFRFILPSRIVQLLA
jgi:hypothetical protein